MRRLGPSGNPQARNLFEIVAYLQHAEGVRFEGPIRLRHLTREAAVILQGTKRAASAAVVRQNSGRL